MYLQFSPVFKWEIPSPAWSCLVAFIFSMRQDLLLAAWPLPFEKAPALGEYHILLGGAPSEVTAVALRADSYITELTQRCGQLRCLLNQMETSYIYTFQLHLIGAKYSRCLCCGVGGSHPWHFCQSNVCLTFKLRPAGVACSLCLVASGILSVPL